MRINSAGFEGDWLGELQVDLGPFLRLHYTFCRDVCWLACLVRLPLDKFLQFCEQHYSVRLPDFRREPLRFQLVNLIKLPTQDLSRTFSSHPLLEYNVHISPIDGFGTQN